MWRIPKLHFRNLLQFFIIHTFFGKVTDTLKQLTTNKTLTGVIRDAVLAFHQSVLKFKSIIGAWRMSVNVIYISPPPQKKIRSSSAILIVKTDVESTSLRTVQMSHHPLSRSSQSCSKVLKNNNRLFEMLFKSYENVANMHKISFTPPNKRKVFTEPTVSGQGPKFKSRTMQPRSWGEKLVVERWLVDVLKGKR